MTIDRLVLMAVALLLCASTGSALRITDAGEPVAQIVTPAEPTATEQFAAEELQSYLRQISGATLTIATEPDAAEGPRLLIGRTQAGLALPVEGDETEAFIVLCAGDDLILRGTGDRGTLYAVYDFLERDLGCRWLGPGPLWESIPSAGTIDIGALDRTESPDMRYRYLRMTYDNETREPFADCLSWAGKQRINIGAGWPQEELPESFVKRGGFRAWMAPHVIQHALDPDVYFEEHPEWYALRGGERVKMPKAGTQQVCTTNPDVVEAVAAKLGEMFDARPEVDFMGLGQGDGTAFCECEACTALDTGEIWPYQDKQLPVITERWLSFCNAVARKLQVTHPGKKIYTLAYHQTFRPPDPAVIRPEPNLMIQVVNSRPNYVCFVHRFEAEGCPRHEKFRDGIERWVDMTPAGVTVYEYVIHSTFCSMPYAAPRKFIDDIRYLRRIGVVGYEGQSSPIIWGTYGIIHYAIAKATWDSSVDADELVRDYCDHAFGPGSEAMQRFYATIERSLEEADHITDGVWTWMTEENMAEARRHLDAAQAAVTDEMDARRLRTIEVGFRYGKLGSEAWRKAQVALANEDAALLAEAVELGEAAVEYLNAEEQREPHYAAIPGKFATVHLAGWKRALERMQRQ